MQKPKFFSLEDLTRSLKSVISKNYTSEYWIKAELHKLNHFPKSGHCYPELVEKKNHKIVARIDGIIWQDDYIRMNQLFEKATGHILSDGITILFRATVEFHPINGLKLNIREIDTDYTLGELTRQKNECIQRLKDEGIYNNNQHLKFPVLPKRIAIISVETSKGYRDLMDVLNLNEYKYSFFTMLFPALLQGDAAIGSILSQLQNIERRKAEFDLVLMIRGGGGDVGLSCFDDYKLASRIATFPLPILAGIGHATNQTVSELVANRNFITPTETGYFLIQTFRNLEEKLINISQNLFQYATHMTEHNHFDLTRLANRFQVSCIGAVHQHQTILNKIASFIRQQCTHQLITHNILLSDTLPKRLFLAKNTMMTTSLKQIEMLDEKLHLLSPEQTLKRGYSITRINGSALMHAKDAQANEIITTQLFAGSLTSIITKSNIDEFDK
ncbi:MAG: exodeoxyribonuclease VII large subunit [Candidatus Competibacteraceae bacterium]|nr:exodeoxyribonuclease VII large subunit [Candidatus Competibacteraceae bacterium]